VVSEIEQTLTDDEIETRRLAGGLRAGVADDADTGDDTGDVSDTTDTGDDTGDDSGDADA